MSHILFIFEQYLIITKSIFMKYNLCHKILRRNENDIQLVTNQEYMCINKEYPYYLYIYFY